MGMCDVVFFEKVKCSKIMEIEAVMGEQEVNLIFYCRYQDC